MIIWKILGVVWLAGYTRYKGSTNCSLRATIVSSVSWHINNAPMVLNYSFFRLTVHFLIDNVSLFACDKSTEHVLIMITIFSANYIFGQVNKFQIQMV